MNEAERTQIEGLLLEERQELLEVLAEMDERFRDRLEQGDGELSRYPLHMADEGTDTMEQEKEFLVAHQEGEQLLEVDESLRRLYKEPERFGLCDQCGSEISFERLEVVPSAKLCIQCKRSAEAEPGEQPVS
jgi:RNA polymerase-binding transcription factor DksA